LNLIDTGDNKKGNLKSTFFNLEEYSKKAKKYIAGLSIQGEEERAMASGIENHIWTIEEIVKLTE